MEKSSTQKLNKKHNTVSSTQASSSYKSRILPMGTEDERKKFLFRQDIPQTSALKTKLKIKAIQF